MDEYDVCVVSFKMTKDERHALKMRAYGKRLNVAEYIRGLIQRDVEREERAEKEKE